MDGGHTPLRLTQHFETRFRQRFPTVTMTESRLQAMLETAPFYPDRAKAATYAALVELGGIRAVVVLALEEGVATLLTVYPPATDWDRRRCGGIPLPGRLVMAVS